MRKRVLTYLMFLFVACALTACGENNEISEVTDEEKEVVEEELSEEVVIEEDTADLVTVTLYSYYTDSYYKVKVDKEGIWKIHRSVDDEYANNEQATIDDLRVDVETLNEADLYSRIDSHTDDGILYNVYNANDRYKELINDKNRRMESGVTDPNYNTEWTDYLNEYIYKNITYTVSYQTNGALRIFIKNPYTNIYDFLIMRTYIGKDNPDYLKIAEQYIDSVEFIEP